MTTGTPKLAKHDQEKDTIKYVEQKKRMEIGQFCNEWLESSVSWGVEDGMGLGTFAMAEEKSGVC
ncbi:hypothetical protein TIFTF001_025370 [Ficus carica]|uniref:Uncharacterized protein n=1 Tax=Ficus carica TaxID=3494 RepID=A0AA88AYR9_FICCA|nr:hypothetical protein TIFTF001_025370 [Ficus carica]